MQTDIIADIVSNAVFLRCHKKKHSTFKKYVSNHVLLNMNHINSIIKAVSFYIEHVSLRSQDQQNTAHFNSVTLLLLDTSDQRLNGAIADCK